MNKGLKMFLVKFMAANFTGMETKCADASAVLQFVCLLNFGLVEFKVLWNVHGTNGPMLVDVTGAFEESISGLQLDRRNGTWRTSLDIANDTSPHRRFNDARALRDMREFFAPKGDYVPLATPQELAEVTVMIHSIIE